MEAIDIDKQARGGLGYFKRVPSIGKALSMFVVGVLEASDQSRSQKDHVSKNIRIRKLPLDPRPQTCEKGLAPIDKNIRRLPRIE